MLLETAVPMLLHWRAVRIVATAPHTGKVSSAALTAEMELEPYDDFDVRAASSGNRWQSVAIGGNQWQSVIIRLSVVISGNRW